MDFGNIDNWRSDRDLELHGVDLPFGADRFITIRRAGGANRAFWNVANEIAQQIADETTGGDTTKLPQDVWEQVQIRAYAQRLVVGWRGFKDRSGADIPYTPDAFVALCEAAPDIWDFVRAQATRRERFRRSAIEQDKKTLGE